MKSGDDKHDHTIRLSNSCVTLAACRDSGLKRVVRGRLAIAEPKNTRPIDQTDRCGAGCDLEHSIMLHIKGMQMQRTGITTEREAVRLDQAM